MRKSHIVILVASLAVPVIVFGGMMSDRGGMTSGCMMNMSMARHHFVMRNGIGDAYRGLSNPLSGNREDVDQGQALYEQHCATCHGESGRGDGPAGEQLQPRPANIARFAKMPMALDAYLFWTISEGGQPIGSAMPPMKNTLENDAIWKIIAYLREM